MAAADRGCRRSRPGVPCMCRCLPTRCGRCSRRWGGGVSGTGRGLPTHVGSRGPRGRSGRACAWDTARSHSTVSSWRPTLPRRWRGRGAGCGSMDATRSRSRRHLMEGAWWSSARCSRATVRGCCARSSDGSGIISSRHSPVRVARPARHDRDARRRGLRPSAQRGPMHSNLLSSRGPRCRGRVSRPRVDDGGCPGVMR